MRDKFGRFAKAGAKASAPPARDAFGRFLKKGAAAKPAPMRDEKGHFLKREEAIRRIERGGGSVSPTGVVRMPPGPSRAPKRMSLDSWTDMQEALAGEWMDVEYDSSADYFTA